MRARTRWLMCALFTWALVLMSRFPLEAQAQGTDRPAYSGAGELIRSEAYREWVYLSSGLGMVYGPAAAAAAGRPPMFTNVFVNPSSYREFMKTGVWPDETMFVLEIRASASDRSISNAGQFQADIVALEAEVKDQKRFADGWAYFNFGMFGDRAAPLPATAACYSCHKTNAAVERTFVQFYPTLMAVAQRLGTVNSTYHHAPPAPAGANAR
jgi:hypothetical protein